MRELNLTTSYVPRALNHHWITSIKREREGGGEKKKEKVSIWVLETWSCATQLILSLSRRSVWPCLKQTALWRESSPNIRQISLHGGNPGSQDCHPIHRTPLTLSVKTLHTCRRREDGNISATSSTIYTMLIWYNCIMKVVQV